MKQTFRLKMLMLLMVILGTIALVGCQGDKKPGASNTGDDSSNGTNTNQSQKGNSIVVGMTQDIVSLDPHIDTDAGTRSVMFNVFEGLMKPNADGGLDPAIAKDYQISEDGKVYTFTLRDDVKFHDGTTVTAEDVKYSIERFAEVKGESSAFSILESVNILDEKTVELQLKEGDTELIAYCTLAVIPKSNENPEKNPIGTGPFKYLSYTPMKSLKIEKNNDYWGEKAYLDQVEFKFIADNESAFTQLQSGSIDLLNYLTIDKVELLQDSHTIVEGSMNLVHSVYFNHNYEPLSDLKVRQALNYAINKDEINMFLFGGKSKLIGSHMIPSMKKYYEEKATNVYDYNIEKAKSLLKEAGYENGFSLTITVPSSYTQHVNTAEIVAEQLKAIGVDVKIQQIEWSSWLADVYKGRQFEATVIGVDGTLAPRDWFLKYLSTDSKNFMNYNNQEFDQKLEQAMDTTDDEEKITLYKELQMILANDAANIYIEDPADFVAMNKQLEGYKFYPIAVMDFSTVKYK